MDTVGAAPAAVFQGVGRVMENALLSRVAKNAWIHRYPRGWPFLLFVLTSMGTVLSVVGIERAETDKRRVELDRNITEVVAGLQRRAAENASLLNVGAALIGARPNMNEGDFDLIASILHANSDRHGSLGVGWAKWLNVDDVGALEAAMHSEGHDFAVRPRPAAGQRHVAVVTELNPATTENLRAIGFDIYSEAARRQAIQTAIATQRPTVTGRVRLMQDNGGDMSTGFLMLAPVYGQQNGARFLRGFIYSPYRVEDFVDSAAKLGRDRQFEIAIWDESPDPERLLTWRQWPGENGPSITRKTSLGERQWVVRVSMKKESALSTLSRVTLLFGVVLALLVMAIARLITKRAAEDRAVLEALTRESAIRNSLTRELNHRVKNTLANVLSIVALTRRRSKNLDEFAEGLIGRVRALSATHDLLSNTNWKDAPIGEVVRSELAPYMGEHDDMDEGHVEISGPDVSLAPNDALSLGLALHELATNAAKYGALSVIEGRIFVNWRQISPTVAEIHWRETGGPPVHEPSRRGFGRDLLEKIVAHELKSDVDLQFRPTGVECTLRVPIRRLSDFELRRRDGS